MEQLMALVDRVRDRLTPAAVVLGAGVDGKGALVISLSPGLKGVHAGEMVKGTAGLFGGGGGGNATLGRAGGGDPSTVKDAVAKSREMLLERL